jgi:hypothetical protein
MKVFKWVLIVFGGLVLVLIAVTIGWLSTVEGVKLTAADFEVGGSYPAEERKALFNACKNNRLNEALDEAACTCVADNARTQLSRYERLSVIVTFERSPTKFAALIKGLMFCGVSPSDMVELPRNMEQHLKALVRSCGFKVP